MSSNVGLATPRGSGTSGYVQRNLSHLRPRDRTAGAPYSLDNFEKHKQRKPDAEILEHERKRRIEVQVFELRDRLEDEGVDEDEIEVQVEGLRRKLEAEEKKNKGGVGRDVRGLKSHQVHDLAKAKIEESERVRRALKIGEDYEEGSHWRKQEERRKEIDIMRVREEEEREEAERNRKRETRDEPPSRGHSPSDRSSSEEQSEDER
jgi:cwf21 domain-containing protein